MGEFDVAVIGMSCRFPGAPDVDSFWRNVVAGVCSIRRHDRRNLLRHGVPATLVDSPHYIAADGFLDDADAFDAEFFGISDREAVLTDPQHRLFLECAWAALEDSGYAPLTPAAVVGCFAAAGMSLYAGARMSSYLTEAVLTDADLVEGSIVPLISVANRGDYLATRVAYHLGLRGPAINVQTACSSALVATHLAIQSLLAGECDLALAGAAAVHVPLACGYLHQHGGILSPTGRCLPFDAAADGTVGGSGVGVVVLKRCADAIADGDDIRAVITGSAINNDGRDKPSFTAPGVRGQREVIAAAHALTGQSPRTVGLVEAHGTGTRLGDPIEIRALRGVLDADGAVDCALGAVKANIGHLDTAAGVAGLIKTVLAVAHGTIPPVASHRELNPEIDLAGSRLYVPTEATRWQGPDHRRAAVSSFGAGGTNAHLVVEQAPPRPAHDPDGGPHLIAVSARGGDALRDSALRLAGRLRGAQADLADVSLTTLAGRAPLPATISVVATSTAEAAERLTRAADSVDSVAQPVGGGPVVLLFPGQGGDSWSVLGRWLATDKDFRQAFTALHEQARPRLDADLPELIATESDPRRRQAAHLQPVLVAAAIALAQTVIAAGVRPALVLGHSLGELAAAAVAGVFSPADAVVLAGVRGRLMDQRCAAGRMVIVNTDAEHAADAIRATGVPDVSVAVINSARGVVLSGPDGPIDAVRAVLRTRGVRATTLGTTHAFHSATMEPVMADFAAEVAAAGPRRPTIPLLSTVTTRTGNDVADPAYWGRQVREQVRFTDALHSPAIPAGAVFVDLAPSGILAELVAVNRPADTGRLVRLERGDEAPPAMRLLLGLRDRGVAVDWSATALHRRARRIALPTYPFRRTRHWPSRDARPPTARRTVRLATVVWTPAPPGPRVAFRHPVILAPGAALSTVDGLGGHLPNYKVVAGWDEMVRADPDRAARVLGDALRSADGSVDLTALGGPEPAESADPAREWVSLRSAMIVAGSLSAATRPVPAVTVTVAGVPVPGSPPDRPDQAAVWGFVRAVRTESLGSTWRLVDTDPTTKAAALSHELADGGEPEIALRGALRLAPLLVDAPAADAAPLAGPLDTVLIVGGTGGIAGRLVDWCAAKGARRVVLAARNRPAEPITGPPGCAVEFIAADVTRPADVERLARENVSLVIAAAGVLRDSVASRVTESDLRAVLAPKVLGTRLLAGLGRPMLAMSSLASLLGSPGQAAYAAANAALESVARAACPPVTCVAWGPWLGVGMSRDLAARTGPRPLPAKDWLDTLDRMPAGTVYAVPDPGFGTLAPAALAAQVWAEPTDINATVRNGQWQHSVAAGEAERFVRGIVAALLRRDSVAADAPFVDLGLDSLAGLRFRRDLIDATGIDLPTTLIYDHPTCAAVAAHLTAKSTPTPDPNSIEALVVELKRELSRSRETL